MGAPCVVRAVERAPAVTVSACPAAPFALARVSEILIPPARAVVPPRLESLMGALITVSKEAGRVASSVREMLLRLTGSDQTGGEKSRR